MTCARSGLPAACLSLLCWRRAALAALRVLISSLNSGGMVAEFSWPCEMGKIIFELGTSKKDNEMHDMMLIPKWQLILLECFTARFEEMHQLWHPSFAVEIQNILRPSQT